ncbi:hypothetical protein POV27_10285 [Aureisphaera galaxeae]|uniref:hypothetical protein n=1 Tax=Aureisphaera galaxeae TaxID=1538023 RepID=UPI0023509A52|nr:hypothetical protein [Aureisphaera galaxeae]MDC8004439.1 hypothetical protein [Aureisphaera galaxeae]
MKKILLPLVLLCVSFQLFSQVGINTTSPSTTLDVNGTIRVRGIKSELVETEAIRIIGVDASGNFVEVEIGDNVILEDNVLRAVENKYSFANTDPISVGQVDDFDLIVLPGEPNDDKKIIRFITTVGDIDLTGIKAGENGQVIWLMAYSGRIKIRGNDLSSDPENRILAGTVTLQQYEMIQLVYDETLQKWIIMDF